MAQGTVSERRFRLDSARLTDRSGAPRLGPRMDDFGDLLRAAAAGSADARTRLHARYNRLVAARVRQRMRTALRRRFDTEDFVQSVFAEVLRDLPRFEDRGEPAFRHWLYLKAEGKLRDRSRRLPGRDGGRREATLATEDAARLRDRGAGPATEADGVESAEILRCLIETLPASQAEPLRLRYLDELPFALVAARLGLPSEAAARMRCARALVALRERWLGRR